MKHKWCIIELKLVALKLASFDLSTILFMISFAKGSLKQPSKSFYVRKSNLLEKLPYLEFYLSYFISFMFAEKPNLFIICRRCFKGNLSESGGQSYLIHGSNTLKIDALSGSLSDDLVVLNETFFFIIYLLC